MKSWMTGAVLAVVLGVATSGLWTGCGTVENALYTRQTNYAPVVTVHEVVKTNVVDVPVVREVLQVVTVTNVVSGAPVTTTNTVQVTNVVQAVSYATNTVTVTNVAAQVELVPKAAIEAAGGMAGTLPIPWLGFASTIGLGLYHAYASMRNRKVKQALVEGGEAVLESLKTPEGQALRAKAIAALKDAQAKHGVLPDVASLVEKYT